MLVLPAAQKKWQLYTFVYKVNSLLRLVLLRNNAFPYLFKKNEMQFNPYLIARLLPIVAQKFGTGEGWIELFEQGTCEGTVHSR